VLYATSLVAYYLYRRCVKRLLTRQAEGPAVGVVAFVAAWTPRRYQDPRAVAAEVRMAVWRPNGSVFRPALYHRCASIGVAR